MWDKLVKRYGGFLIALINTIWINFFPYNQVSTRKGWAAIFCTCNPTYAFDRWFIPLGFWVIGFYLYWKVRRDEKGWHQ